MTAYADFLQTKRRVVGRHGIDASDVDLPAALYGWQAALVRWALRKGRAAIFADCGLGKTFMQVAWADALRVPTLILAPLCVAEQTVAEAAKLGIAVGYARDQAEAEGQRIVITNYERLERFNPAFFGAVVLDESSILKAFDGQTRNALIAAFAQTPYRLCCTATPSPNDITELANHAEFLGVMPRPEFLATWFIRIGEGHRTTTHHGWRMKHHAVDPFYRWLASWAVALRSPRDLGFDDTGFELPPLTIRPEILPMAEGAPSASLFPELGLNGIQGRLAARRTSLVDRLRAVSRLTQPRRTAHGACQWLLWCGLNEESDALAEAIPDAVDVAGSDSYEHKVEAVRAFVRGDVRVLISKIKVLGFGMNLQQCHHMAFVGMSDSYEGYYQGIRRCWRFGQTSPVSVHIVVSEAELQIVENVRRKEVAATDLSTQLLQHLSVFEREEIRAIDPAGRLPVILPADGSREPVFAERGIESAVPIL
jgi:hypothetical protein